MYCKHHHIKLIPTVFPSFTSAGNSQLMTGHLLKHSLLFLMDGYKQWMATWKCKWSLKCKVTANCNAVHNKATEFSFSSRFSMGHLLACMLWTGSERTIFFKIFWYQIVAHITENRIKLAGSKDYLQYIFFTGSIITTFNILRKVALSQIQSHMIIDDTRGRGEGSCLFFDV